MNDLEAFDGGGGELAPYSPSQPPAPSPDWGGNGVDTLTPRELDEYQGQRSGQVQLFGAPMPPGTTPQQLQAVLGEIGGVYMSDFAKLGHPHNLTQSAIKFFMDNATKPPQQVRRLHAFNLHDQAGDWLAESFGNYLHSLGGTQAQKQKFLSDSLWWLGEVNKRLGESRGKPIAREGTPISTDPTDQLTDQQYSTLVKHNENVKAQTMDRLSALWGRYTFKQNIALAQAHLESLDAASRKHFDQFTGGWPWTHMLNTYECLTALYGMAIGSASLPTGADIDREIKSIENVMKTERKKYMADPQLQARYRTLLDLKEK